jgi:F-type H+-transporting ATPase subunit b
MISTLNLIAATEKATGISALGLDPLAIVAQAITFLAIFFFIKKFALGGIVAKLEERRRTIDRGIKLTHDMDKLKDDLDARVHEALKQARHEADVIISEARDEAGTILRNAEEAAQRKTDTLIQEARGTIERDMNEARKELTAEVADLVVAATEAVLREKVDQKKDAELLQRVIDEVRS